MMHASELSPLFLLFTSFAFIIGCCIGSFMNVVVWRLPRGEKLSYPPSHCPKCGHTIRPWENIPIISWLCLRARCSSCHLPISIKYPIGEAVTGLLFTFLWLAIYKRNMCIAMLPPYFYLAAALLAAALIDAEHRFIPDKITYSGAIFAFAWTIFFPFGRLATSTLDIPAQGNMLLSGFLCLLNHMGLYLTSPNAIAIIDCLLGMAFGFAVIFLFAQGIKILLPGTSIYFKTPTSIKISGSGIEIQGKLTAWDSLLPDSNQDLAIIHGHLKDCKNIVKITANAKECSIDNIPYTDNKPLKITATQITTPKEAMGWGDIKLMAMVGSFLGADASIYILFEAAVLALLYAIATSALKHRIIRNLPFGPAIAIAACLWMLIGNVWLKF